MNEHTEFEYRSVSARVNALAQGAVSDGIRTSKTLCCPTSQSMHLGNNVEFQIHHCTFGAPLFFGTNETSRRKAATRSILYRRETRPKQMQTRRRTGLNHRYDINEAVSVAQDDGRQCRITACSPSNRLNVSAYSVSMDAPSSGGGVSRQEAVAAARHRGPRCHLASRHSVDAASARSPSWKFTNAASTPALHFCGNFQQKHESCAT